MSRRLVQQGIGSDDAHDALAATLEAEVIRRAAIGVGFVDVMNLYRLN